MFRLFLVLFTFFVMIAGCASEDPFASTATITVSESAPPGTSESEENEATQGEIAACADSLGVDVERIVVRGCKSDVTIASSKSVLLKVKGNKAVARLTIRGDRTVGGVCVFAEGNKSEVHLTIDSAVGKVLYQGKGNKSVGKIVVDGSVETFEARLLGNKSILGISGSGDYDCPSATVRGNKADFSCN